VKPIEIRSRLARLACRAAAIATSTGVLLAFASGCGRDEPAHEGAEHAAEEPFERGPHGGRLLTEGDFALELAIFEAGVPPEFHAFAYQGGDPVDPASVRLDVTLSRLGGRVDRIAFAPRADYLLGAEVVREPHSFDAEVVARVAGPGGREHRFAFSSYENRVTLAPDQLEAAGISVVTAGPATIRERVDLNGRVAANEDALAHVMPRFPGVVRAVHKRLGDEVTRGDVLAVIESNESLHPFELRAPLTGAVIAKDVAPGEFVATDRTLFEVADLASVWVDLDVYRRDFGRLRIGQPVRVDAGDGSPPASSTLAYLSPIGSPNTQTLLARAVLPNPDRSWRPGLFVTAEVEVGASDVPVAVAVEAIQRIRDRDMLFIADGNTFEAQPVELGRRDATHAEIVSGLQAGQRYAAVGSFVLKAEAGKSGASHDH
jgi:cobalt-zinc-cadmium efflux system membrane fusion protein